MQVMFSDMRAMSKEDFEAKYGKPKSVWAKMQWKRIQLNRKLKEV